MDLMLKNNSAMFHEWKRIFYWINNRLLLLTAVLIASGCAIQSPQLKDIVGEWEANHLVHSQLVIHKNGTGLFGLYFDDVYICPITNIEFEATDIELKLDCSGLKPETELHLLSETAIQKLVIQASGDALFLIDVVDQSDRPFMIDGMGSISGNIAESLVYLRTNDLQFMRNILKHRMQEFEASVE